MKEGDIARLIVAFAPLRLIPLLKILPLTLNYLSLSAIKSIWRNPNKLRFGKNRKAELDIIFLKAPLRTWGNFNQEE